MTKRKSVNNTKFIAILFLLGVGFWRIGSIPLEVSVTFQAISVMVLAYLTFTYKAKIPLLFKREIIFIFIAVAFSTIMAAAYHDQDIVTTLIEQRFMYFYLVYFALAALNVSSQNVEKAIKYVAIFFGSMYLLQFLLYPADVFYYPKVLIERSTFRFRVDGFEFLIFLAAFAFNKVLNKQLQFYPLLLLAVVVNFLSGSRYLLVITAICIALTGYKSKALSFGLKVFIVGVFLMSFILFLPKEYTSSITEKTKTDLQQGEDYIRIPAAAYYLTTYNVDVPTWLFGNGVSDSHSQYGIQIQNIGENFGFYLGDIGFIGEFVRFGIFYFLIVCVLLYRAIKHSRKVDPVLNSYLIGIALFYIISWPFGHGPGIILFASVLYLINKKSYEMRLSKVETENTLELQ